MTNPPESRDDKEQRKTNRPSAGARKSRTPGPAATDGASPKKPFSMSYDGVSSAEYIKYMIDRGSR
jgi:hypothetical protein